jgi:hypothetical protein
VTREYNNNNNNNNALCLSFMTDELKIVTTTFIIIVTIEGNLGLILSFNADLLILFWVPALTGEI